MSTLYRDEAHPHNFYLKINNELILKDISDCTKRFVIKINKSFILRFLNFKSHEVRSNN